jgi:hypothetical protein
VKIFAWDAIWDGRSDGTDVLSPSSPKLGAWTMREIKRDVQNNTWNRLYKAVVFIPQAQNSSRNENIHFLPTFPDSIYIRLLSGKVTLVWQEL